jgi:hypothetical protein
MIAVTRGGHVTAVPAGHRRAHTRLPGIGRDGEQSQPGAATEEEARMGVGVGALDADHDNVGFVGEDCPRIARTGDCFHLHLHRHLRLAGERSADDVGQQRRKPDQQHQDRHPNQSVGPHRDRA